MHHQKLIFTLMLTIALLLPGPAISRAAPTAQTDLPPATIVNEEGGPKRLVGSLDYTDFSIRTIMKNPAPALLDMVHIIRGDKRQFAPVESQILGFMTTPVFPPPLRYAFDLPIAPTATLLDVDNDGAEDTGVQIFWLIVSANINGLSHLEQLDQATDTISYLTDPVTGQITEGNLLVYAPDDQQGFPSGFGPDGILFTADDPAVGLPQGYTVVHFGPDGFTFDRAAEATLDLLPNPEAASPDFSDQGIVESFNSLIDHLALRYSFTELRKLDWEAVRAHYLPQVEEAEQLFTTDATAGAGLYGHLLHLLAQEVRDAHVTAVFNDIAYLDAARAGYKLDTQPIATNLGANTVALSDGRIIVTDIVTGSPAAEAGWTLGTEIVAVNGTPVAHYLPTVVYNEVVGTDEGQRLAQVNNLLKFPAPAETAAVAAVTIDAILPGATAAETFTLTPGVYALPDRLASAASAMPIQYHLAPTYGYLTWNGFTEPEVNMAVLRQFLAQVKASPTPLNGVILDLRGNGGGWDMLYFTMASYFFNAEQPVAMHWVDMDAFDPNVGDLVRKVPQEYLLSAPDANLYYGGSLVILIDPHCASSCEFFTQFLQTNGRATVVGQHASDGAGAPINRIAMPFGLLFQYTKGRSYFAGTEELNLEGKGVVPDVRVPVTEETERAKLEGGDPVLDAALAYLQEQAASASTTGTTTPGATETMTTTESVTTTEALTSATLMPNLADYPHLMAAQSFFPDKILPTIEECISLFSPDAYPRPEPDYTGKQARDLSAFADALADFTPERAAELDALVLGKTIPQLQALFDDGDLTAEELVLYYVDRIRRYDIDKLNSVLTLNPEALELARTLDAELAAGTVRGAMHGIPVLLKDNIATGDGMPTTAGAAALQGWVPDRDAFLVQQIRAAGGIILGKANLSEWANYNDPCMPSGFSVVGGQTRHPYGPFDPLGSSSGSAVSVAANLTTVSVGSETSGSLIQPSRVNSVVGLRPSQGLISRDYVVPLGAHLDTPGPMGRSLTDVAILLNAMIGVDANDPKTNAAAALANVDFTTYLDLERAKGLRVGVVMYEETIAAQRAAVEESSGETIPEEALPSVISAWVEGNPFQAKAALEAQGITVVEIKQADLPPDVDTAQPQLIYGFGADLNAFLTGLSKPAPISSIADVVAFNEQDMANRAPYNQRFVKWSAESELTPDEHAQIVAEAQAYANAWMNGLLETYDVDLLIAATKYAGNAGAAGIPALTIPAGLDATGKPTGIIITGPYLSEPDLFAVGYALEQAIQGRVEPDLDATLQQIAEVTGQ